MIELVKQYGERVSLKKGDVLMVQGATDGNFYIVNSGLLKVFYLTNTGKEFVKSFIDQGGHIASIGAMQGVDTCPFNIVALENTELLRVPGQLMLSLGQGHPKVLKAINEALMKVIQKKEKREYEFLCLSAEERYIEFKREYADLERRVSQYDIARYLGITPVALSRIRKGV